MTTPTAGCHPCRRCTTRSDMKRPRRDEQHCAAAGASLWTTPPASCDARPGTTPPTGSEQERSDPAVLLGDADGLYRFVGTEFLDGGREIVTDGPRHGDKQKGSDDV